MLQRYGGDLRVPGVYVTEWTLPPRVLKSSSQGYYTIGSQVPILFHGRKKQTLSPYSPSNNIDAIDCDTNNSLIALRFPWFMLSIRTT
jgi:hypothetical protein